VGEFYNIFQNEPVDVSEEFSRQENHFFVADSLSEFDPASASGTILWKSRSLKQRVSYHQLTLQLEDYKVWEDLPPDEYEDDRSLPFDFSFVTPRTVRVRLAARPEGVRGEPSLMLVGEPPTDDSWSTEDDSSSVTYHNRHGSVIVRRDPLRFEFRDASDGLLTRSYHLHDATGVVNAKPTPFSFVRNTATFHRHIAASFGLSPGEKLFGCGESFTKLDKRGQKLVLWTYDAYGSQTPNMYKPVPFFLSDRGYGMFAHTSAPLTFDLGHAHDGAAVGYLGDDQLDLFFFFGSPKEILSEFTALTGRAPAPPLWTFVLWIGRQSYSSEEVRTVAKKLREERIPVDVIHLDTGWPETPHRVDFEFSPSRFPDPEKMLSDLKNDGFRISLWQLPYFNPMNRLHREATGDGIIFARSAWAGSQRYPLHWGGDAENSDGAMAGTLRGLSLGLCGFSFWSHFIGGFSGATPEDLYRRWMAFGALTPHARCHGRPPTEPWEYGEDFTDGFRRTVEVRYRLMPYVYA
jgi:alpha-D-xyloside xylohydrolase